MVSQGNELIDNWFKHDLEKCIQFQKKALQYLEMKKIS